MSKKKKNPEKLKLGMNVWDYLLKDFSPRLCNKKIELPEVFGLINCGDDGPVMVKKEV